MTTFLANVRNGAFNFGSDYNKQRFLEDARQNEGARYRIERITPESQKQRGFLHGAVYPLWVYLDENDHRDSNIIDHYHHEAKKEFNGGMIVRDGEMEKYGKSTKGVLNKGYLDRVIDNLEAHYGIDRGIVLDTKQYKHWKDDIYPAGGPDNYVDYMVEIGLLKRHA